MPSNLLVDGTKDFSERAYLTAHLPILEVPGSFKHAPPSAKPTPPTTAGMTAPELAEVAAWLDGMATPTLPDVVTYVSDYEDYNAAIEAWRFANEQARIAQYRIAFGDALIYNRPTTSASADTTGGGGSSPPPPAVYPRNDP